MSRIAFALLCTASIAVGGAAAAPAVVASHSPGTSCATGRDLVYAGHSWIGRRYDYRIIRSSLPGEFMGSRRTQERVIARIRDGMRAWNEGRTDCHRLRRFGGFNTAIVGDSGSSGANHDDSINTIDFVTPPFRCGTRLGHYGACAYLRWRDETTRTRAGERYVPREVDVRFNKDRPWHVRPRRSPCVGYDLWSTAAHEVGHVVGLGELTGERNNYQTMYNRSYECVFRRRELGRSDWIGLTRLYTRP